MTSVRRAGVLGTPIEHSLSPVLHNAAYQALGLQNWNYDRYEVNEQTLHMFLAGLNETWAGLSLTMPLKQRIFDFVDHVDPLAEAVGAINTVLLSGPNASSRTGVNTDVYGIVQAIKESVGPRGLTGEGGAVVIGGGATAFSALAALGELGYTSSTVGVRNLVRSAGVEAAAGRMGVDVRVAPLADLPAALINADVVISTVPAAASNTLVDVLGETPVLGVLLDVVYHPRPTPFMNAWLNNGGAACSGERMLLHQAAEQVRLMTGQVAPVSAMDQALTQAL